MKKIHLLFFASMILVFGACSNDEIIPEQPEGKKTAPQLMAIVEQAPTTKSGVIEDNDYTLGEKFYWSNEDATTVFFRNPDMSDETQYKKAEYEASVAQGVQSNNCTFNVVQSDVIDNGQYTAYGLFPTSAWELRANYFSFLTANIPAHQTQTQPNSTHLGAYMLMKAQNDVTVDGENAISLSYKHLASVLRFAVWNNSGNSDLKLANINLSLSSGNAVFYTNCKLNDIDATSLTTTPGQSKAPTLTLQLTGDARNFATKDGKSQCEGYMAVLPTDDDAFDHYDDLIIELSLTDGTNNYLATKTYNIGTDLSFLTGGIEQGKSYYFQLKVDNAELVPLPGTVYAMGDYWPSAAAPEGIVFWVKPGSFGTQGKVVGLGETYAAKWGPDNDEEAAGVGDIRSYSSGADATRNLINKYRSSGTFATDYPAFHYIYNTVNDDDENGDWYLPARDELKMLYAGYSGKVYESIVDWTSSNMPGYNSAECIAAQTAFNEKLTDKGGDAFGSSGEWWYLSSSEVGINYYSFNFENGRYSVDSKSLDGYIRWIQEF
jgi:hypothetical protein